ncbi:MAG TPA: mechanosensitive ion channel family protein [Alphaproteobacteria bacterium]|jgi:small-conductance mechanosensitive channel|nr:mechanosensitive ion channel family protein [Alphaproteobacteria bacterium]
MIFAPEQIATTVLVGAGLLHWWFLGLRHTWVRFASGAALFAVLTAAVVYTIGSPLQPKFATAMSGERLWQQVIITAWWLLAGRAAVEVTRISVLMRRIAGEGRLFSDLLSGIIYLIVTLTIVKTVFSFPIGGLLATSGIIAIVLGLALQNTLADVFAGIAVGIERPYAIGDQVWFEGPIEGEIVQINWRSVQIRTMSNDIATIPNSVVAKSRFINRNVPSMRRSDSVQVPCTRTHPPEYVIALIQQAILLSPNVLEKPPASVALVRVGKRLNHYEISFSVANSSLLWQTKSMLLREILRQFSSSGSSYHLRGHHPELAEPEGERVLDIALLEPLAQEKRDELEGHLVCRSLQAGDTLFAQGDTDASLFVIRTGVLEVSHQEKHDTIVIGRIGPGDYIGEIGMLTGAAHPGTVKALTPSLVYELRQEFVAPLIKENPELLHAFEASARRGQARIDRGVAANIGMKTVPPAQLLDRMRAFFAHVL